MNTSSLARESKSLDTNWQSQYKNSIKSLAELCHAIELSIDQLAVSIKANSQFPLRVPWSYVDRIKKSNPNDPLLLQILPHKKEEFMVAGFTKDPVGDLNSVKGPGLLKKYHGRALLLVTGQCAIHCRYCFRRHFPYSLNNPRIDKWTSVTNDINDDDSLREIILSGGDPLTLSDELLQSLFSKLESIRHLERIRIHTRFPVVIPQRITRKLIEIFKNSRIKIIVVLHINHAQEINSELRDQIKKLAASNCTLLNQSVLLHKVNDDVHSLTSLSESLFNAGVMPYYLHLLDKVEGAVHFNVSETVATELMKKVSAKLPGYLVPKLVSEIEGYSAKNLISY